MTYNLEPRWPPCCPECGEYVDSDGWCDECQEKTVRTREDEEWMKADEAYSRERG